MNNGHFCFFCKHHIMGDTNEKDNAKRLKSMFKPYSCECKCELQREEHNYFSTFGNDCCIISSTECDYFESD